MYRHIIPGGSLAGVTIPACAHIGMRTRKHAKHMSILFKRFMMVGLLHHVSGQVKLFITFFYKNGNLCCHRLSLIAATCNKGKWMLMNKIQYNLSIFFFIVRKVVHKEAKIEFLCLADPRLL